MASPTLNSWRKSKHLLLTGAITVAVLAVAVVIVLMRTHASSEPQELLLADGTQVILLNGTHVVPSEGFPQNRDIQIQGTGDVFVKARAQDKPLIVRTGLLILTVEGESAFRAAVSAEKIGEQAEVLYGHVEAAKAYESRFSEPDVLVAGEMSMINRSIDLMEKEKFDPTELAQWSKDVVAAAERHK